MRWKPGLRRRAPGALLLVCALLCRSAAAVEVETIAVQKHGKTFKLQASSVVAVPRRFVFDILMDFDDFHRLVAGMVITRYLEPDADGTLKGYTRVNSCAWIFCTHFEKVERMWAVPDTEIVTLAIPEQSDFEFYATHWQLEQVPGGTRLRFEATVRPDFWVPPLLGAWVVRRKLELTATEMGERVEYLYATGKKLSELPATGGDR